MNIPSSMVFKRQWFIKIKKKECKTETNDQLVSRQSLKNI